MGLRCLGRPGDSESPEACDGQLAFCLRALGVTEDRDPHGADLVFPPCVLSSVSLDTLDANPQSTLDCQAVSGWYVWEACCLCERHLSMAS